MLLLTPFVTSFPEQYRDPPTDRGFAIQGEIPPNLGVIPFESSCRLRWENGTVKYMRQTFPIFLFLSVFLFSLIGCAPSYRVSVPTLTGVVLDGTQPVVGMGVRLSTNYWADGVRVCRVEREETETNARGSFTVGPLRTLWLGGSDREPRTWYGVCLEIDGNYTLALSVPVSDLVLKEEYQLECQLNPEQRIPINEQILGMPRASMLGIQSIDEAPLCSFVSEESKAAKKIGETASSVVLSTFMSALQGALKEGGAAHAVSFCNVELPQIATEVRAKLPEGVTFKRVSSKVRNPNNAPDVEDRVALNHFEIEERSNRPLPGYLLQRLEDGGFRYYSPLKIGETCLQCHGPRESLPQAVRSVLEERYKNDEAHGYSAGDFRGLLRIAIPKESLYEGLK
ncbi:MAG: DUF3365 domain-containing protein [Bdellovibrionales bacterium]|nr:DUF3365 domain-containing protein [Bdellovibrionales bacterium]